MTDDDIRELAQTVTADQALYATEKFGTDLQWEPMMLAIRLYGAVRARDAVWNGAPWKRREAVAEVVALLADEGLRELLREATAPSV